MRSVKIWLLTGYVLVLLMVVIGGITRLTGSGLSIVEWNVISGTIPPLNHADWLAAFSQYKKFPQYLKINSDMTLSEFKSIYFWEYLHRFIGRIIGLIFLIPYLYFLAKDKINPSLHKKLLIIMGIGICQAIAGWLMVKSGLVDLPHVSHFRLAIHLSLALVLSGFIFWTYRTLEFKRHSVQFSIKTSLIITGIALLFIQIILGAFVAGLKAGFSYNTFPLMNGEFIPSASYSGASFCNTLLYNGVILQFLHRWTGIITFIYIIFIYQKYFIKARVNELFAARVLIIAIGFQVSLGILTLVLQVPLFLGILHQVTAFIAFTAFLNLLFENLFSSQSPVTK